MIEIGEKVYPKGSYPPKQGFEHDWHVWCCVGAMEVLEANEFEQKIKFDPEYGYTINFANNSSANITPTHPLWQKLAEVAETFTVEVFPLALGVKYVPWNGEEDNLRRFDAIKISAKTA